MEYLKTILIAIVQGITEFLPVSSSGHITLFKNILHFDIDDTFDIFLHMGTLLAVILFYRKECAELILGLFKKEIKSTQLFGTQLKQKDYRRIWLFFIIATIPAGISGILIEPMDFFDFQPKNITVFKYILLAFFFLITTTLLISTRFIKNKKENSIKNLSFLSALTIGLFQAIAPFPGVSRSGTTISAGLFTGLKKEHAARFSFLLSIPLIFAAFLLKLIKLIQLDTSTDKSNSLILWIGLIVAFIIGYIALKLLITLITKGKFWVFSLYMIIPIITTIILAFNL